MERICACTAIRFCSKCEDNSYRKHFADMLPINLTQGVQVLQDSCPNGLSLIKNFISESEEDELLKHLIADEGWKPSQSGRRKIDFGPSANFKKKK